MVDAAPARRIAAIGIVTHVAPVRPASGASQPHPEERVSMQTTILSASCNRGLLDECDVRRNSLPSGAAEGNKNHRPIDEAVRYAFEFVRTRSATRVGT